MKKQINPTIKAHLIRGAFYLLLLVAVCAIPFALAQSRSRGTAKQSVAKANAGALARTAEMAGQVEEVLSKNPDVDAYVRRTGSENGIFATQTFRGDISVMPIPRLTRRGRIEASRRP